MSAGDRATVYTFGQWEVDLGRRELRAGGNAVRIGSRAFAIIEVLVRAGGQLVSGDALMSFVWPGISVADNTLQVHISAVRKALGSDRGLLRTTSGRGYRLVGPWVAQGADAAPDIAADAAPVVSGLTSGNLPVATSDLIGRAAAVQYVRDLLSAYRIVTLTGAGGAGKTRLALEVVRHELAHFEGGGWLVELASVSASDLVPSVVATVLGLELGRDEATPMAVARAIGERPLVLLLDNCEHVIEAAAGLAESIMGLCPRVSILATSRELLRVEGEYAYRVPSLDLPPSVPADPQAVLGHSAVQLFLARMQGADASFVPGARDLLSIAAICRRLDGMPLAIEFAAARAAALGVEQVLARLDDRFEMFTVGRRTALPRHQTLRATLDWSYELLPAFEQRLLRRVAIFTGGFTIDAAVAVMSDTEGVAPHVIEGVANLVEKSLVALDPGTASRWRILETTRSYALEKLAAHGETRLAARLHAQFFSDLFGPGRAAAQAQPALERMAIYDNVRAALDWAFSADGDTATGTALAAAFGPFWIHFSLLADSNERIEQALKSVNPDNQERTRLRMQLLFALGLTLLHRAEATARTRTVLSEALAIAEQFQDIDLQLQILWALWIHHVNGAEPDAAEPYARRFADTAHRSGDPGSLLVYGRLLGNALHYTGRQAEARRCYEEVIASEAALGEQRNPTWSSQDQRLLCRARLGRVLWLQGLVSQARQRTQQSLEEAEATDHTHALCFVLAEIACPIALMTGDLVAAERAVNRLTGLATEHGMTYWARFGRCHEGVLSIRRGDAAHGAQMLRSALATFRGTRQIVHYLGFIGVFAEGLAASGQLDEAHRVIDAELERYDRDGRVWCLPELRRVKGELVLLGAAVGEAELWFGRAMELAAQQGALFWELRAALSLAGLMMRQERAAEARRVLEPVYARCSEGLDMPDLQAARALLG
jgi:predicted ATPase/DNA-binding winged helix-turn-helix (wHTH) protein